MRRILGPIAIDPNADAREEGHFQFRALHSTHATFELSSGGAKKPCLTQSFVCWPARLRQVGENLFLDGPRLLVAREIKMDSDFTYVVF